MTIGISRDGDVLTLEFQRPERRNALNAEVCDAVRAAVIGAPDDGVRAIVITGQGTSFCAGADLTGGVSSPFIDSLTAMHKSVLGSPLPVIAAVNGPAVGAGVQVAIAADLRVVAPHAHFAIPAAKLGVGLDAWTVRRLSAVAGGGIARSILLAAAKIDSERALACGLASEIGDLAAAQQYAHDIAGLAPLTLAHLKMVLNDDGALDPQSDEQQAAHDAAWASKDLVEAYTARTEKRQPVFRGE